VYNLIVKRKVKNWEEYPLEDVPKLLYTQLKKTVNFIIQKIVFYRRRPGLWHSDLKRFYHRSKYNLQSYIDPAPPQGKKERTDDYFERIDPKYGLRFYKTMVALGSEIDLGYALPQIDMLYKDKETRNNVKEIFIKTAEIEQNNKELLQKYIIRSEILKEQN
jgi:hypothetical protein